MKPDRPPRRGAGEMEAVGGFLYDVLAGIRMESRFQGAQATDEWTAVVGPEVARRTRPVGVRDGELLVEVQGAVWMGHLAVLRQGVLEALNRRLPDSARLKSFRLVPMRFKEERIESEE